MGRSGKVWCLINGFFFREEEKARFSAKPRGGIMNIDLTGIRIYYY